MMKTPPKLIHRISWMADLHLETADDAAIETLIQSVQAQEPDLVLLAGDCELAKPLPEYRAIGVEKRLQALQQALNLPLIFILGNHDFYFGSIERVRQTAQQFTSLDTLFYLHAAGPIELNKDTVLLGHDGWADGTAGDLLHSRAVLNDFFLIDELKVQSDREIFTPETATKLQKLGKEAATYAKKWLPSLLENYPRVLFLTHVPPFRQASLYHGLIADADHAPFFVCQQLGDALLECAASCPNSQLTVLCGHSHHRADYKPLPNLQVLVAEAEYRYPKVQPPLSV